MKVFFDFLFILSLTSATRSKAVVHRQGWRERNRRRHERKRSGRELSSARSMEIGMLLNSGWRILFLTGVCVILGAREQPTD